MVTVSTPDIRTRRATVSKVQPDIPQQQSESRDKRSHVVNLKYLGQLNKRRLVTEIRDETSVRTRDFPIQCYFVRNHARMASHVSVCL